jgi:hypothetical protein
MSGHMFDVTSDGWLPGRGDYGAEYAADLIALIEASSCRHGCAKSGTQADRDEYGPGGNCVILAMVCMPERQKELEPRADGPVCTAREPLTAGAA